MLWDAFDALIHRRVVARGGKAFVAETAGWPLFRYDMPGTGSAPPVVLVHGLAGDTHNFFSIFEGLRKISRRVLAFDLPGHGRSPLPSNRRAPNIETHYEILSAFLDEDVGEPAILVGNSMGGALVAHATAMRPETVLATALLSPAGAEFHDGAFEEIRQLFGAASDEEVKNTVTRLLYRRIPGTRLVVPHFRRKFQAPAVRALLENGYQALETRLVESIRQPLTLVWGDNERILPPDGVQWFRNHLPRHSRVVVLDKCGHAPQLEHPKVVLRLMDELVAELVPAVVAA